jgi:CBS domain containing-hemolysin-like protein
VEKIEEKKWRVYGKTAVKDVNLELNLDLPEEEDTIAGFLLSQLERIPRAGEIHSFPASAKEKVDFFIERATARRIVSVILEVAR